MTKVGILALTKKAGWHMKKTSVLLMVAASLMLVEIPIATIAASPTAKTEVAIGKRKKKGYKKKRGGLFNTGLFRKKNPCGCPNH